MSKQKQRPLSPHLTIYKPIPTMVASITHRITGVGLYFGVLFFSSWLVAIAAGELYFNYINSFMTRFFGSIILLGFIWLLLQHIFGGIKHLFWDFGYGFDKKFSTKLAYISFCTSTFITVSIGLIRLL